LLKTFRLQAGSAFHASIDRRGSPSKARFEVPLFDIVVGERHIVGTFAYIDQAFNDAAAHLASGKLDIEGLVRPTVSMEETPDAFAALSDCKRREVKIMMHTGAEARVA
jgi:threonine dehydrogenase-like Zn-dependent dehydrogenase